MTTLAVQFPTPLSLFHFAVLGSTLLFSSVASDAAPLEAGLGLQLWSLRAPAKENPFAALDLARSYGVTNVETAGTWGLSADAFSAALRARRLNVVSAHYGYDRLQQDLRGVIAEARAFGAEYVVVPWLKNQDGVFDAAAVARDFDRWGAKLRAAGLKLGYHPHGFEFRPLPDGGTRFDTLVTQTKPENVCFEMDVFWVVHAGVDPVALLNKYPDRWRLMHLKDLRRGADVGTHTGRAPATDNVPVGEGVIDWPAVLAAAQKVGVVHCLIEDETTEPLKSIPASLAYLRNLGLAR
ncbi:MAG: sugar phosphate isomerase/epimerase [Opitutae bacterium]|nr:sugar phosphate isomerase/epimerase [Opitutae bacterium]